jgi:tetratricopeptide (TPR) repeat protein
MPRTVTSVLWIMVLMVLVGIPYFCVNPECAVGDAQPGNDFQASMAKGNQELQNGNYAAAIDQFQRALQLKPNDWYANNRIGHSLLKMKKFDEAIKFFSKSNSLNEKWGTHQGLAFCYSNKKDYTTALNHAKKAVELAPNEWQTHNCIGQVYYYSGAYDNALASFRKSNSIAEKAENYNYIGAIYIKNNQYLKSIENFEKAILFDSQNWSYYRNISGCFYMVEKYDEGIRSIENGLKVAKNNEQTQELKRRLINLYVAKGEYKKACDLLESTRYVGLEISKADIGIKVEKVLRGGPGELAGLVPGDIISEFGGDSLSSVDAATFSNKILQKPAQGAKVRIKIFRDGKYYDKNIIVGLLPDFGSLVKAAGSRKQDTKTEKVSADASEELMMPPGATIAPELLDATHNQ